MTTTDDVNTRQPVLISSHYDLMKSDHVYVTVRWRYEGEEDARTARKAFPTPPWTIRNILREQIDIGAYTTWEH
jgi:hypothetical protein